MTGASSLESLQLLVESDITVYALNNLHTKLYIFNDSKCIVGSANFTNNGFKFNHEMLLVIDDPNDVKPIVSYANNLLANIQENGNWVISADVIKDEKTTLQHLKIPKHIPSHSWGANITNPTQLKSTVLSVAAGATVNLIEDFLVHAHPLKPYYNYKTTEFITFREDNGGAMSHVYKILYSVNLNMRDWEASIETLDISIIDKSNLIHYINSRIAGFGFDLNSTYKFYILENYVTLRNNPRPRKNNAGTRYYVLNDLIESTDYVYTYSSKNLK